MNATTCLRLNHAGELGAIAMYRAQIRIGERRKHAHVAMLRDILQHEYRHYDLFSELLAARGERGCRMLPLAYWGGALLGLSTALLGERAVMVCTRSAEDVVNRHLEAQLRELAGVDSEAHDAIASIVEDERSHQHEAQSRIGRENALARLVHWTVVAGTAAAITFGICAAWADQRLTRRRAGASRSKDVALKKMSGPLA